MKKWYALNSTCIIMLGMHRSGTSVLAGSLKEAGLYLGNISRQNKYNLKGNQENIKIRNLNNYILKFNRSSWDKPPLDNNLIWDNKSKLLRNKIILSFSLSSKYWGFKDPRTIFTLPFWIEGLRSYKIIGTYRHPLSVANSLKKRNNIPIKQGLELWKIYNENLLKYKKIYNFPIISFDLSYEKYLKVLKITIDKLDIPLKSPLTHFYNNQLIHFNYNYNKQLFSSDIYKIYFMLNKYFLESLSNYSI